MIRIEFSSDGTSAIRSTDALFQMKGFILLFPEEDMNIILNRLTCFPQKATGAVIAKKVWYSFFLL